MQEASRQSRRPLSYPSLDWASRITLVQCRHVNCFSIFPFSGHATGLTNEIAEHPVHWFTGDDIFTRVHILRVSKLTLIGIRCYEFPSICTLVIFSTPACFLASLLLRYLCTINFVAHRNRLVFPSLQNPPDLMQYGQCIGK